MTNFNDGMVSSFTRNTTTGVLKLRGQVKAGAKQGPRGLVASPSNGSFLYVAVHQAGEAESRHQDERAFGGFEQRYGA